MTDTAISASGHSVVHQRDGAPVRRWLWIVLAAIYLMVIVGGITRLTGSGLSMVEWRPLMGALPPLSEAEWQRVFEQYQASPQYQQVNHWMGLSEFQRIFFWEYLHRLLGRLVGVVALVPWVWFLARRRLSHRTAMRTFLAFLLGGLQGLLGWYMVKSGLAGVPEVSHFRLAAHLSLAFLVGGWVLWLILDLHCGKHAGGSPLMSVHVLELRRLAHKFIALLALQIIYGAFVAGTRGGVLFATFPDMNGYYLPGVFFTGPSPVHDLMHSPLVIHWVHRFLAWIVVGMAVALVLRVRRQASPGSRLRATGSVLGGSVLLQFALGALTVTLHVPVWAAVAHQAGAFLLLGNGLFLTHQLHRGDTGQA
ncbi:MAG: COX15/CtaA family protein [Candidatus Latescibacterota bacterium]|nr:COX15/CtaA family protein [Candidatus Latescibacterota bacterium]